jgi:hypothetical protein
LTEGVKRFFKLFTESTFEGSRARRMKKDLPNDSARTNQKFMLFHSLHFLIRSDNGDAFVANSPLLVLLQFVDPNVLFGEGEVEPLHHLADLQILSTTLPTKPAH